jgi:hypothetical protein
MSLGARVLAAVLCFLVAAAAFASDRPYLAATNAVVDEDDDNVTAVESFFEFSRRFREFRFEPEYNFDPRNAVRVELGVSRDRRFEDAVRKRGAEVEFKHFFTDLARAGYGTGVIVALDWDDRRGGRASFEEPAEHRWAISAAGLMSLQPTPDTLLHLNLGGVNETGEGARARWALAVEHAIVRRTAVFAEAGATAHDERLIHGGVRHWIKRERFAVDLTVGRRRGGDVPPSTFITLGIALQDISW